MARASSGWAWSRQDNLTSQSVLFFPIVEHGLDVIYRVARAAISTSATAEPQAEQDRAPATKSEPQLTQRITTTPSGHRTQNPPHARLELVTAIGRKTHLNRPGSERRRRLMFGNRGPAMGRAVLVVSGSWG